MSRGWVAVWLHRLPWHAQSGLNLVQSSASQGCVWVMMGMSDGATQGVHVWGLTGNEHCSLGVPIPG